MIHLTSVLGSVFNFLIGTGRFLVMLGILVFVHELGHFFAAKLSNVYVVRLSLGWGKRLFGFKWGETDYSIAAIPIGGYVKMVGQEDTPRTEEEAAAAEPDLADVPPERRFNNQPVLKKLAISFSGPFMNLLFALPVLWLVFMIGIQVPVFMKLTWIGAVTEGSPAEEAGLRAGLRILSIDGKPVTSFDQIQMAGMTNENRPLHFELEDIAGNRTSATVTPRRDEGSARASMGIAPFDGQSVESIFPGMAAERGGMRKGDIILTYQDNPVGNESMGRLIEAVKDSAGSAMRFTVLRDGKTLDVTLIPDEVSIIEGAYFRKNVIAYIDEEAAEGALEKLAVDDVVTAVDGIPVEDSDSEDSFAAAFYDSDAEAVELTVTRAGGMFGETTSFKTTVPLTRTGRIGVGFSSLVFEKFGPLESAEKSIYSFFEFVELTLETFYYLISAKISPKELAGPIGIAVMTEQSLALGAGYYLKLVALISINLAIVNLLPIPLLDGGMICLTLLEAIRRKPLEEKYLIIVQKIGVVFIAFIFIMVMYNDALRVVRMLLGGEFLE